MSDYFLTLKVEEAEFDLTTSIDLFTALCTVDHFDDENKILSFPFVYNERHAEREVKKCVCE